MSTLLITATALEAAPLKALPWRARPFPLGELYALPGGLYLAHLGVAKVNTAAGLALALQQLAPEAVVQFGVGGAFAASGLPLGGVAVASGEVHMDTGVQLERGWQDMEALGFPLLPGPPPRFNHFPTDLALSAALAEAARAPRVLFGTSECVTGSFGAAARLYARFGAAIESMEGAAAAQVCAALKVPFAEVRGVSNRVGERDKARWDLPGAVRAVNAALKAFLDL
ncbi:futalosine hydrolase [Truepera radiovictrix]|uniref:Futalosine hydrolase n=1 Tax=Truepera radiovictrix (strain DSM 17093 / CIP 108686 / LMG 22925 / RQ-24) TaxID=649638 RepID=D7CWK4_TRURR|nr:futalosine hydrolase [Truepera radiovictrix]ADI14403.1 futalosine nucleosidase [Truepera radiovictrix DSM 17093]WMT57040.1 futalosine hydrolase [Truepera radiovictrix]